MSVWIGSSLSKRLDAEKTVCWTDEKMCKGCDQEKGTEKHRS